MTSEYPMASLQPHAIPEVHVVPVRGTAKWRVHDGDPSEPASEHVSTTAAEAAAHSRAMERGVERIVIHDRYHRTRLVDSERVPDQHSANSTAEDQSVVMASASDDASLR